jgi:hypothetical protein
MEDDHNIFENGRQPPFSFNERQPQFLKKEEGLDVLTMQDDLKI